MLFMPLGHHNASPPGQALQFDKDFTASEIFPSGGDKKASPLPEVFFHELLRNLMSVKTASKRKCSLKLVWSDRYMYIDWQTQMLKTCFCRKTS